MVRVIATAITAQASPSIPCDISDLESAGTFALFDAYQLYNPEHGSFRSFARLVIWRGMMGCLDAIHAKREVPLKVAENEISPRSPEDVAAKREQIALLRSAIDTLPKRLRRLVYRLYEEGVRQREMAGHWGITEGRLSQLNDVAMRRIRAKLCKSQTKRERQRRISGW